MHPEATILADDNHTFLSLCLASRTKPEQIILVTLQHSDFVFICDELTLAFPEHTNATADFVPHSRESIRKVYRRR
jgi:hypothetical protein